MTNRFSGSRRRPEKWSRLLILTILASGCDSLFGPNRVRFADDARVIVEGTSSVPLLLITSTNFTAQRDPATDELRSTLVASDTVVVSGLPVQRDYNIRQRDRFLVRLVNPSLDQTAAIHIQVLLDGRIVFNQQATMQDATLEYIAYFQ